MSSSSTAFFRDFRGLLRHMRALPSFKERTSPLRQMVLEKVRFEAATKTHNSKSMKDCLHALTVMSSSIKELNHLRGLDTGEKLDPRDKIRATAGRVGLGVPKFADEFSVNDDPSVPKKDF